MKNFLIKSVRFAIIKFVVLRLVKAINLDRNLILYAKKETKEKN